MSGVDRRPRHGVGHQPRPLSRAGVPHRAERFLRGARALSRPPRREDSGQNHITTVVIIACERVETKVQPAEPEIDQEIIIVGTGFSGLGMAIALIRAGITSFLVLERGSEIGGTWRDNHYPGAACDIPSHLYSFSFE